MIWSNYHTQSEQLASQAEIYKNNGEMQSAQEAYKKAAELEEKAIEVLESNKPRTFGITAVSAISLYYKSREFSFAEQLAYQYMAKQNIPKFAVDQIRSLLQAIWNEVEMAKAGLTFLPGQVFVAVRGGEVIRGGAPLDLVVEKVQTVQNFFYRTAELLRGLPHRKKGSPDKDVQGMCRPWLLQAVPSSYQFAVAVQDSLQTELFDKNNPKAMQIAEHVMAILKTSMETPDNLSQIVANEDYQNTFLKLTRNLAPTGKTYEEMEIHSPERSESVALVPASRAILNKSLRNREKNKPSTETEVKTLSGILRAVHLDQDWLEITVESNHIRVNNVGDAMDDIIGPMVNRPVTIRSSVNNKGQYSLLDIEPDN